MRSFSLILALEMIVKLCDRNYRVRSLGLRGQNRLVYHVCLPFNFTPRVLNPTMRSAHLFLVVFVAVVMAKVRLLHC